MPRALRACPVSGCPYTCRNKEDLNCHRRSKHPEDPANAALPLLVCSVWGCDKIFERRQVLREHEAKVHGKGQRRSQVTCKLCGQFTARLDNVKRHMGSCRRRPSASPSDSGVDMAHDKRSAEPSVGTSEQQSREPEAQTTADEGQFPDFVFSATNTFVEFFQSQLAQDDDSFWTMVQA